MAIWREGYLYQFDGCTWNHESAKFHMALGDYKMAYGQWVQNLAAGIISGKNEKYFAGINLRLEIARDKYLQYLKYLGIDIENIDTKKLDYE